MPYKSKKQRAWMHIHEPEIAKKWDAKYGGKTKRSTTKKEAQMTQTLFNITYDVASALGILVEGTATGGSATTVVDTINLNKQTITGTEERYGYYTTRVARTPHPKGSILPSATL